MIATALLGAAMVMLSGLVITLERRVRRMEKLWIMALDTIVKEEMEEKLNERNRSDNQG